MHPPRSARRRLAGRAVLAGLIVGSVAITTPLASPAADAALEPVPGGPVILDGNDPHDHVGSIDSYIAAVYTTLTTRVAGNGYVHNDQVAVIGTCDVMLTGMVPGETFVPFDTAAEVEGLFADIGTNNYQHVHICSDDDPTLTAAVENELDKWGSALAQHVNRGGGLFATGHSYNWLGDLFPTIAVTFGGTNSSYVTAAGNAFFGMPVNTQVNAINHYTFGDPAGTPLLSLLSESSGGAGKRVAIGGTIVRFPQISIQGPTSAQIGEPAEYTLVAATADGVPISNNAITYTISGPTTAAVTNANGVTDANGEMTFTFTGSSAGTTEIRVQLVAGGQTIGSARSTVWASVPAAPTITSAIDVVGHSGAVQVSWNDGSNGGRPITDYVIEWSTDAGTTWHAFADGASTTRTATVTGLDNGSSHLFRVAAINSVGQGPWSAPLAATPTGSPEAPALGAQGHDESVTLSWVAPAANGAAITGYTVGYRVAGPGSWTTLNLGSNDTSTTVPSLTNGVEYEFRIAATNAKGQGAWSVAEVATPAAVPGPVDDLRVIEGDRELRVEWAEPDDDGGSEVTGYEVSTDFGASCAAEHWHPTDDHLRHWFRCTFTGLTNGVDHEIAVAAKNATGTGVTTAISGNPFGTPTPPVVTVVEEDRQLVVDWTPADGNGRPITEYRVYVDGVLVTTVGPDVSSHTVTGLDNGTSVSVTVVAVTAAGASPVSTPIKATPADPKLKLKLTLQAGDTVANAPVVVTGSGLKPFSLVRIEMHSTPVLLGTVTTDAIGSFVTTVHLPAQVAPGQHQVIALGESPDGATVSDAAEVFVDWSGSVGWIMTSDSSSGTAPGNGSGNGSGGSGDGSGDGSGGGSGGAGSRDGYVPVTPTRVLDTRVGDGPVAAGTVHQLSIRTELVPANATAVVLNLAVDKPEAGGFVTVYPCGVSRPWASALNHHAGQTVSRLVTAQVRPGQQLCLYTLATTHLVVDVNGYHSPTAGDRLQAAEPVRLADTRTGARVEAGQVLQVPVPASDASAAILYVAVDNPTRSGFLTVFPCGQAVPLAANVNFVANQIVGNSAITAIGDGGAVCVYASVATDVVVDHLGVASGAAKDSFVALVAGRAHDTRTAGEPLAAGEELRLSFADAGGAVAVDLYVAVDDPSKAGFLTVYPCGEAMPLAAALNYAGGQTTGNLVTAKLGADGDVCVYTMSTTHVVVDVTAVHTPG